MADGNGHNDHLPDKPRAAFPEGIVGNLIGFLENVHMKKIDGKEAMVANLRVIDAKMREKFLALHKAGRLDKIGFSIDVAGTVSEGEPLHGVPTQNVESIDSAYALDVVTHPAAGGRSLRVIEGELNDGNGEIMNKLIIAFLESLFPAIAKEADMGSLNESGLVKLLNKTLKGVTESMKEAEITGPKEALELIEQVMGFLGENKVQEALDALKAGSASLKALMGMIEAKAKESADAKAQADADATAAADAKAKSDADAKTESDAKAAADAKAKADASAGPTKESFDKLAKEVHEGRVRESAAVLRAKLAESGLPMPARERIAAEMKGKVFTEADAETRINDDKDYLEKLTESGAIRNLGGSGIDGVDLREADKVQMASDLLVDPSLKFDKETKDQFQKVESFAGLKEAWVRMTGDRHCRFDAQSLMPRMMEATTASFPRVLGDSITRHLLKNYRGFKQQWRNVVTPRPLESFRTQRPIRWGTFDDLAIVAEDAVFTALNNPTETETTYAPQKRGRTFSITREMIMADDLRKLRGIGPGMGRAAARTLEKFVWNLIIGNTLGGGINTDLVSDGTAIYTAGHANLGAAALDNDSMEAALIRLMLQTDEDSNETLGFMQPWLIVPVELSPTADRVINSELISGSTNNDRNANFKKADILVVPYLGSDANNWYLAAKQSDLDSVELGFVEGEQEPTVLIQDDPRVGAVFTNERITYKVRHEYGGAVTAFQGLDGSIVA